MNIRKIDFERALLLMNIMEKQANVSPMLTSVSGEAAEELKGIAEDCRQNALERADRIRQEEQAAEQKRLKAVEADREPLNPKPQPQPPRQYMPGEPDPNVRSSRTDGKPDNDPNANLQDGYEQDDLTPKVPLVDRRV